MYFEFLNKFKRVESSGHLEVSEFSNVPTKRGKPKIDDIYYNVNELKRLVNQGVDVSNFMVAYGIESEKNRIGKKLCPI